VADVRLLAVVRLRAHLAGEPGEILLLRRELRFQVVRAHAGPVPTPAVPIPGDPRMVSRPSGYRPGDGFTRHGRSRAPMTTIKPETGDVTGTRDRTYDLVWYLQSCLENALRLEQFREDAESQGDKQVVDLFTKAQADSRKGAELAKGLLSERLSTREA
jgi:hypothetical protein